MRLGRKGVLHICRALLCGGLLGSGQALAETAREVMEDTFWDSVKGCIPAAAMQALPPTYPTGRYRKPARVCPEGSPVSPPGTEFQDCSECPKMVVVPAGSFMMGSPPDDERRHDDEGPQHRVTIGDAFAVGKYEVTFEEWDACFAAGGCSQRPNDAGWGRGRRPVIGVTWHDAQEYLRWLSDRTGRPYRLLSEAEWAYAARAGTVTDFHWGDAVGENRANCDDCGSRWDGKSTAPVGSFPPNGFGLHDMHGNVSEWVEDCWHDSHDGAPSDGSARTTGVDCSKRTVRGGSWFEFRKYPFSERRGAAEPGTLFSFLGFRVALTLPP